MIGGFESSFPTSAQKESLVDSALDGRVKSGIMKV